MITLGAMAVLVEYQTVGLPIVSILPWIGTIIVALNMAFLLETVVMFGSDAPAVRRALTHLDRVARLGASGLALCAAFVGLNATFDRSPRIIHEADVVDIGWRTVSAGVPLVYSWARIALADGGERSTFTFALGPKDQSTYWRGEAVVVGIRRGAFGLPWIDRLVRNDEVYLTSVLRRSPDARGPRRSLVAFLLLNGAPAAAAEASHRYVDRYPADAGFAYWAGENMNLQGRDDDAIALLTRATTLRPTRYTMFRFAWVLTRHGDVEHALEVLDDAIRRYPDAWEFPFLAGYNLITVGKHRDALTSLERVEELRPGVPGVIEAMNRLRAIGAPVG